MTEIERDAARVFVPVPKPPPVCPACGGHEQFEEGEIVDVGFGPKCGPKCGPDLCGACGYVEAGADPNDLPLAYYRDRHETGIDPIEPVGAQAFLPPRLFPHPFPQYAEWIKKHVRDAGYGQCRVQCIRMRRAFPHLEMYCGVFLSAAWGSRHHYWLADPRFATPQIVDPTYRQFPEKFGLVGTHAAHYRVDPETGLRLDLPEEYRRAPDDWKVLEMTKVWLRGVDPEKEKT